LLGLGTAAQTAALEGAKAQIGAGTMEQQTKQADLTANYQQFLQERGYPFQVAQFLANIAMGTGALSGSTTTTTQPAGIFSDERLKKDAKRIGQTDDGLPIYTYKYKNDDKTHMGVMAQDVEKKHPEAVGLARASDGNVYKTVDYGQVGEKERAYGGGLDPNSMGGAVYEPGEYSRGGYAVGGGLVSDTEARSMIAGMRRPAGVYDQGGLYGSTPYQTPYGTGLGIRGDAVPVPSLVLPSSKVSAPESGLKQALSAYQNLKGLGDMGKSLYEGGEKALFGSPESKKDGEVVKKASRGLVGAGGQRDREKGYLGLAVGGRAEEDDSLPYGSDSMTGNQDIMSDVVQSGAGQVRSLPKPGEPPKAPDTAKELMGLASMGKSAVEGFGSLSTGLSGLGSALGAGSTAATGAATAAGAAGAAGGLGSALGSIGSGIASIAPMFLAFLSSDERMKHNKQKVGELNDGQPVYRYDYGDGVTQLGLMAQDVEKHHPEAVMEHKGLKYVNYDRATEDAVHKYAGGLVYRQPHADGERVIPNYSEEADMPALGAIEVSAKEPDFRAIAVEKAKKHGVDADAMLRIIQGESSFNPRAVGDEGSSAGLGQFHVAGISQKYPNPGLGDSYFRDRRPDLDKKLTPQEKIAFLSAPENQEDKLDYMAEHASKKGFGAWTVARKLGLAGAGNGVGGGGGGGDGAAAGKPAGLTGFASYLPTKKDEAGVETTDWKRILVPLLTGAAGMAAAPTRNFGTALAMGLGAGAQSYADLDKKQADIEKTRAETKRDLAQAGLTSAQEDVQRASLVGLELIRGFGYVVVDRSDPKNPQVRQVYDQNLRPTTSKPSKEQLDQAVRVDPKTLQPVGSTGDKPPAGTATPPGQGAPAQSEGTAAGEELKGTKKIQHFGSKAKPDDVGPSAPDWERKLPDGWGASTEVPQGYTPDNQIMHAKDPELIKIGQEELRKQRERSEGAGSELMRLDEMNRQFRSIPQGSLLTTGAGADARLDFAKKLNTALSIFGGSLAVDPNTVAAAESIQKGQFRLGTDTIRGLGREPGFILERAVAANPGITNTEQGYARISSGLQQVAQRELDYAKFLTNYYTDFGHTKDAYELFRKMNPETKYIDRAIYNSINPLDREGLRNFVSKNSERNPNATKNAVDAFNKMYGSGAAQIVLGRK
jgi:hypothetical protein